MKNFLFSILFCAAISLSAQSISYHYDNTGNRTERIINMQSSPPQPQTATEITPLEDLISGRKLKIYPNPTEGMLSIAINDFTMQIEAEIRLSDMS